MKRVSAPTALIGWLVLAVCSPLMADHAAASDSPSCGGQGSAGMVITKARVIDGAGHVLEAGAGIPMISTLGVFVPFFGKNNEALFRDGTPFPWERLYHAGDDAVQARLLWNAGITYGFGTDTPYGGDTGWLPRDTLAHEIRSLSLAFSPRDIVTIMTGNSAVALGLGTEIGTLEPGKWADIVLLDGDPLENSDALLNVRMVIKGGKVMVDRQ